MSTALWMNIPLMVLAFALWVGVPLWMVLRRKDWQGKQETRSVPAYLARRPVPVPVPVRSMFPAPSATRVAVPFGR